MRSLAGLVERAALIPQVKLNLHLRRDPHNSNSELFLSWTDLPGLTMSHTDNMARIREYFHVATDEGRSFPLRLRQIDSILSKLQRPLGEATSAPIAFVR